MAVSKVRRDCRRAKASGISNELRKLTKKFLEL